MGLPDVVHTVRDLRAAVASWRRAGGRVALVPTMGALHEGHLALVRRGREIADRVVVSIFVNPKQFAPGDDFDRYPRVAERDRALLSSEAELVYAPGAEEIYPPGFTTTVSVAGPSQGFEGAARPGHFDGVATVCAKLFTQSGADVAVFGEKDWQQLQVVTRMVRDLDLPIAIEGHPTVRDAAGLALSSRNAFLDPADLARARCLNGILKEVAARCAGGARAEAIVSGEADIAAAGLGPIDYLAAVDAESMESRPVPGAGRAERLVAAVRCGTVRLLDNMPIPPASVS